MKKGYLIQKDPFVVPTSDGKLIEEFLGLASINAGDFSFAHMSAPPGWGEPFQTPEFDEMTYVISGKKLIEINGERITLEEKQAIFVKKGTRVRYSHPSSVTVEYISVCFPAFSIDKVHREDS